MLVLECTVCAKKLTLCILVSKYNLPCQSLVILLLHAA